MKTLTVLFCVLCVSCIAEPDYVELKTADPSFRTYRITNTYDVIGAPVPIASLEGIERARRIRTLKMSNHPIVDVEPLRNCLWIEELSLSGTLVDNIEPLANLKLKSLAINDTDVADLSPLKEMYSLRDLEIVGTKVTDISALSKLKNLRYLNAGNLMITKLDALPSSLEVLIVTPPLDRESLERYKRKNPKVTIEFLRYPDSGAPEEVKWP